MAEAQKLLVRYAGAALIATGVAIGLFLLMRAFIAPGEDLLSERIGYRMESMVRLKRESEIERKQRVLPDRRPPEPRPATAPLAVPTPKNAVTRVPVKVERPALGRNFGLTGTLADLGTPPTDADTTPVVRITPIYPRDAAERGIEGWVLVEFTIDEQGNVRDPEVVAAQPRRVFERATLQAIRKWRYRPKIVDGKAVATPGIQVKLTFDLDDLKGR